MTHADVLDCLSANRRITFLATMPAGAYKGSKITVGQAIEYLNDEDGEVEEPCPKGCSYWMCEHDKEEERYWAEVAEEKNEQRHW